MTSHGRWWDLPRHHPRRIHHQFMQAAKHLRALNRDARASDEPAQWEIEMIKAQADDNEYYAGTEDRGVGASVLRTAQRMERARVKLDAARALWEAAGRPNRDGKRTSPRNRARMAELLGAL